MFSQALVAVVTLIVLTVLVIFNLDYSDPDPNEGKTYSASEARFRCQNIARSKAKYPETYKMLSGSDSDITYPTVEIGRDISEDYSLKNAFGVPSRLRYRCRVVRFTLTKFAIYSKNERIYFYDRAAIDKAITDLKKHNRH